MNDLTVTTTGDNFAPFIDSFKASLNAMYASDGTAENKAVDFVRDALSCLLNGALSIDDVAAIVIAKYEVTTKGGKAPKGTVAGLKNGIGRNGRDCQALAKRLDVVDFVHRNAAKVPGMIEAFIRDDVAAMVKAGLVPATGRKSVSVNGLRMAVEAAVRAMAASVAEPETEAEPEAEVETVADTTPVAVSLADTLIAIAATIASCNADELASLAGPMEILANAYTARLRDLKPANAVRKAA